MLIIKSSPTYIFSGSLIDINNYLIRSLKEIFCKKDCSDKCNICNKIENKKHESIIFLEPEGQYTLSQLNIIFNNIIFKLEENSHFFFIIHKAELLNLSCSNSLLKILEEPPTGYHFILITSQINNIIPTIRSRAIIKEFNTYQDKDFNKIFKIFTSINKHNIAIEDIKEIENIKIPDYFIIEILDQIYSYFLDKLKNSLKNSNAEKNYLIKIIDILDYSKKRYPMPGSSKIFFKNLYLNILKIYCAV